MDDLYEAEKKLVDSNDWAGGSIPEKVFLKLNAYSTKEYATDEWTVTDKHGVPTFCECGHHLYEYEFVMHNIVTNKVMIVGSTCIHKFGSRVLISEMNVELLRRKLVHDKSKHRVKYLADKSFFNKNSKKRKYLFKVRKNTKLYKCLIDVNSSEFDYLPFFFNDSEDCYIKINHKFPKKYEKNEWYEINIMIKRFDYDGGKTGMIFHYRS